MSIGLVSAIGCVAVLVGIAGGLGGQPAALRYGLAYGCLVFLVAVFGVPVRWTGAWESVRSVPIESGQGSATKVRQSRQLWSVLVALTVCCAVLTVGPVVEKAPAAG